jgi:hypothetical protein
MPVIGRIVKSNSHMDYVCQIFAPRERTYDPIPEDYAFGRFVSAPVSGNEGIRAVGVVYDTILLNPEYGSLGPRLNPPSVGPIVSPDYLVEKATAVGILTLGLMSEEELLHGIAPLGLPVDAEVSTMSDEEVRRFHLVDGRLSVGYLPNMLARRSPLVVELSITVVHKLGTLFTEQGEQRLLRTLLAHLAWKARVEPLSQ